MNNRALQIVAALVLLLGAAAAYYLTASDPQTPAVASRPDAPRSTPAAPAAPVAPTPVAPDLAVVPAADLTRFMRDRVMGNPDAAVTIIEYASFTCPHCANFHNANLKDIKERYIDTGKVKFIFRDFPLDGIALRASAIARCAPETAYFGFVEVLFKSQATWASGGGARSIAALEQIARLGGLGKPEVDACMANEALLDAILKVRQDAVTTHQVQSTPSFVINGKTHAGDMTVEELAKIVDPLLVKN